MFKVGEYVRIKDRDDNHHYLLGYNDKMRLYAGKVFKIVGNFLQFYDLEGVPGMWEDYSLEPVDYIPEYELEEDPTLIK